MGQYTDEELIDAMIGFYEDNGRWPKLRDMVHPYPGKTTYARRFASAPDKDDGFSRALTMSQIQYSDEVVGRKYDELNSAVEELKSEVRKEMEGLFVPVVRWINRSIMKFKEWIK